LRLLPLANSHCAENVLKIRGQPLPDEDDPAPDGHIVIDAHLLDTSFSC